ncbi:MAG: hypothetical protein CL878_00960 [Dehalococcoidia bacterium]|nr:hypothetical protein [Dehalococcoidia bacterium]
MSESPQPPRPFDSNNTSDLLNALGSDEPYIRLDAAIGLAEEAHPAAVPTLIEALSHERFAVRFNHSVPALERVGEPAVPALMEALDQSGTVRPCAAAALYAIDQSKLDSVVLPALLTTLDDADEEARRDAAWALAEIGKPASSAVSALIAALDIEGSPPGKDRRSAVDALVRIGEPKQDIVLALVQVLTTTIWHVRTRVAAARGLPTLGKEAKDSIPTLTNLLKDAREKVDVRVECAYALAALDDTVGVAPALLIEALQDGDWYLRVSAARVLARMGERAEGAVPQLAAALRDHNYNVRRNAGYALAKIGRKATKAIPSLLRAIRATDVGGIAAETLAKIGGPALPALTTSVSHPDERVRGLAAHALRKMDMPEAEAAIEASGVEPFAPTWSDFLLPAPDVEVDDRKTAAFAALFQSAVAGRAGDAIEYDLPYPKHEFLDYLIEKKDLVLHGSSRADMGVLKPHHRPGDPASPDHWTAVYATPDGILSIYFAVIDRPRLSGASIWFFEVDDGEVSKRVYHFSMDPQALREQPWTNGMIYIMPRDTFEDVFEGAPKNPVQVASRAPVRPLARLPVSPGDFPFRKDVRGSDYRMPRLPLSLEGLPFLDTVERYVVYQRQSVDGRR